MRLVLVLAVVIGLVVALWFALAGDGTAPVPEPVSIEPARNIERAVEPPTDLAASERTAERVGPTASTSAEVSNSGLASVVIVATLPSGPAPHGALAVDFRDPLARAIELDEEPAGIFRASGLAPGEYTIWAVGPDCVPLTQRIQVRPSELDQRSELQLTAGTTLRIRWQTSDGRPFLDVLAESNELVRPVLVQIAVDGVVRGAGDSTLRSRRGDLFSGSAGAGQAFARGPRAWANAPPDAVRELTVVHSLPVVVWASIDGVIVASAPVDADTSEIVLSTDLDTWNKRRATVRFCLVEGAARDPVRTARWSGTTRAEASSPLLEVGQDGCGLDMRFLPGSWLLHFQAPGRQSMYREVDLAPGTVLDLGELSFDEPGSVVVSATLPDGSPASAVRLGLIPVDRFVWGARSQISTDAEGKARFVDLTLGPHVLVVTDARFTAPARVVEPRTGDRHFVLDLPLESGVEIALDTGPRAALIEIAYLYDGAGNPLGVLPVPPSGLVPLRLVPGDYVVELEGADGGRAFTVTGESAVFDVR